MKRDIIYSLLLHVVVIGATVFSSPFAMVKRPQLGEVIRVQLTSLPGSLPVEPTSLPPAIVPQAAADEPLDIPISDPTKAEELAVVTEQEKPEPKPPRERPKPSPAQPAQPSGGGDSAEGTEVEVSGGAGSPFAGATVDNARFNYPYWFTQTFNKIQNNLGRNPVYYEGTLVCLVYFQVIRSGRIVETEVRESSGWPEFDAYCLAAINRSQPLPPLPRDFADEIIGITIPFKHSR